MTAHNPPSLREALQELVRLKKLKETFERYSPLANPPPTRLQMDEHDAQRDEYERLKPLAWAAAEAAIAAHPEAVMPQEPADWPPRFKITSEGLAALFLRKHFADHASMDHVTELAGLFDHVAQKPRHQYLSRIAVACEKSLKGDPQ